MENYLYTDFHILAQLAILASFGYLGLKLGLRTLKDQEKTSIGKLTKEANSVETKVVDLSKKLDQRLETVEKGKEELKTEIHHNLPGIVDQKIKEIFKTQIPGYSVGIPKNSRGITLASLNAVSFSPGDTWYKNYVTTRVDSLDPVRPPLNPFEKIEKDLSKWVTNSQQEELKE